MKKLSLYFILFGCAVFTSQTAVSQSKKTDGELIENLIAKKKEFNKEFSYGHRIQLYNGFEDEARAIQKKFKIDFPEIKQSICPIVRPIKLTHSLTAPTQSVLCIVT